MALLVGRFLAFIRTLLPILAGISGLSSRRFQFFNWLRWLLWVGAVIGLGYSLSMIPFIKAHEDQVMTILMILPVILLLIGLFGTLVIGCTQKVYLTVLMLNNNIAGIAPLFSAGAFCPVPVKRSASCQKI